MTVEMNRTSHCWESGVTMPAEEPDLELDLVEPLPVGANWNASRNEAVTKRTMQVGTSGFW
jgi:hypothetical protein